MQITKRSRSIAKTLSWRISATIITAAIVYVFTGKFVLAIQIGSIEVFLKMFFYYLHERAWDNISYGKVEIQPMVLWFTGLSGSGKSTIAAEVEKALLQKKFRVERLDGDRIRSVFPNTGFNREDRDNHIRRVGFLASMLERNGVFVVASMVSPYEDSRNFVRSLCKNYHEIYVSTPLEECERRDVKGLYAKARSGKIENFTGISDPYEVPKAPDFQIDTTGRELSKCVEDVLEHVLANLKTT